MAREEVFYLPLIIFKYAFVYMSLPFIPVCELLEGRSTVFIFVTFIVSRTFQELTNDR